MNTCSKCERDDIHPTQLEYYGGMCSRCHSFQRLKEDSAKDMKSGLQEREALFAERCPAQYQDNDTSMILQEQFDQVTGWRMSPHGLLCQGESHTGKTTSCWRLLEILFVMHGIKFEALTELEFADEVERRLRLHTFDGWFRRMCDVPVLFLDDLGHAGTDPRFLGKLCTLFENRTKWKRPIICTTQFDLEELMSRGKHTVSQKTVIAILNRLNKSCKLVRFHSFGLEQKAA